MPHPHVSLRPPGPDGFGPSLTLTWRLGPVTLVMEPLRRRKRKDPDRGGVPVEPNRPNTLSGGAAAPLEFDDE
jgi:hypothetical protein